MNDLFLKKVNVLIVNEGATFIETGMNQWTLDRVTLREQRRYYQNLRLKGDVDDLNDIGVKIEF